MENSYVKASEISEYLYCKRSWWMRFNDQLPVTEQMMLGTQKHEQMAQDVRTFKRRYVVGMIIVIAGVLLLALYFLLQALI